MSKNVLFQFSRDIDLPPTVGVHPENQQVVTIVIQSLLARRLLKVPDRLAKNDCRCNKGQH